MPKSGRSIRLFYAAALLTLGYAKPEKRIAEEGEPPLPLRSALRQTLKLAPALLAFTLLRETAQEVAVFLSQPLYLRGGFPLGALGLLSALATVAGLVGGFSHRAEARLGRRRMGAALFALAGVGCLLPVLSVGAVAAVCAVLLCRATAALMNPLALSVQNEYSTNTGRATQLSCNAMLMDVGARCLYPAFGGLAEAGLDRALLLGTACCAVGLFLFLRRIPCAPVGATGG